MQKHNKIISVIIPVFNEEASIGKVIKDIPSIVQEIVLVDNNSTDATSKVAKEFGATVIFEKQKGYGIACLTGIEYLKNKNVDILVFLDGDYSDYAEELIDLVDPIINDNFDFILGSRVLGEKEKWALPMQSQFGSIIAGFLMNLFWKVKYTDLGPFRAIKFDKLLALEMEDEWFGWTIEMQIKAAHQKLKVKEIPVKYRNRIDQSKVTGTIKGTIMASIIIMSTIFKFAIRLSKN
ncbi:MAG: glycosyltransferase family 2 protein [Ignavibacteriae bacterium]|nr:glycosyltransferase family 2 protein [Ignavibacteriota bacterium]